MEQTSAEILDSLKPLNIDKKAISILKDLFQTSDFVKFAKLKPGYDENEASVKIAESFIDETEEKCVETDDKEVISNETEVSVVEKPVAEVKKNDDSEHDKYMPKG